MIKSLSWIFTMCILLLALPSQAGAVTILDKYERPHRHSFVKKAYRWMDQSKVAIPENLSFRLLLRPCPSTTNSPPACAVRGAIIWLGPKGREREVFLHELGHILEPLLPDHTKRSLLRDMRAGTTGWDELYKNNTRPGEWYADYFAHCAMHGLKSPWRINGWVIHTGPYDKPEISAKAYRRICTRLNRVYKNADVAKLPVVILPPSLKQ